MRDFLSCLPSSLVWGPSPAPWERLPLLRRSPPRVTDIAGGHRILLLPASASLCHFCQDPSVPPCSWILPKGMETCTALPRFPGAAADQPTPSLLQPWHPRMPSPEPGLSDNVLGLHNAILPLHTASFLDGNAPRSAIAPQSGVSGARGTGCSLLQGCDRGRQGEEEVAAAR